MRFPWAPQRAARTPSTRIRLGGGFGGHTVQSLRSSKRRFNVVIVLLLSLLRPFMLVVYAFRTWLVFESCWNPAECERCILDAITFDSAPLRHTCHVLHVIVYVSLTVIPAQRSYRPVRQLMFPA